MALPVDLLRRALRKGPVTAVLRGGSMTPCIPHGSRVTLAPLRRSPRRGDVLAVLAAGRVVVHRLVDLSDDAAWIRLQGDAQPHPDPWLPRSAVLAVALAAAWRGRIRPLSPVESAWWRAGGTLVRWARAARRKWRESPAGGPEGAR